MRYGNKHTPEYWAWRAMKQRCLNPNCDSFKYYGARGITVCERWLEFQGFIEDMGLRPSPDHSLDRIENDKGYEPGNCRWRTAVEQNNNTRWNHYVEWDGRIQTTAQWSRERGLPPYAVCTRPSNGWSIRDAILTPLRRRVDSKVLP